ncbi:unnamed protein product [Echinostoma caproni]|uniref:Transposase n=1 Tax=Echinostoma caproni TaxID=27848 RepID=A0A183BC94_9TREM|nr:unnamed protein product [Echinostoma caproni]
MVPRPSKNVIVKGLKKSLCEKSVQLVVRDVRKENKKQLVTGRLIECARRGDDLKEVAKHLGIKIKICRAIAAADREGTLKPGSYKTKLNDEATKHLCDVVDENPTATLRKLKERMETDFPGTLISKNSIGRLLDGHHYSIKKLTIQPIERNTESVKVKRVEYADWL